MFFIEARVKTLDILLPINFCEGFCIGYSVWNTYLFRWKYSFLNYSFGGGSCHDSKFCLACIYWTPEEQTTNFQLSNIDVLKFNPEVS